jgi:hypothetical protein
MVHSNRIPFILLGTGKKKLTVRFRKRTRSVAGQTVERPCA